MLPPVCSASSLDSEDSLLTSPILNMDLLDSSNLGACGGGSHSLANTHISSGVKSATTISIRSSENFVTNWRQSSLSFAGNFKQTESKAVRIASCKNGIQET